jgi:hypothetical protein
MAKEIATPKVNAGGGFSFEDKTVAYLLACLLDDKPPLDSNLGTIERLDFQVRVDGWHLDDVLITLNANDTRRRCAMSVKSNQQFTKDAAPGEFVTAAWEIFLDPGRMNFDRTHDLLGIATAPLDAEFHSQLHELLSWARVQRSGDLPGRVAEKGYGNKLKRSLLKSFACPAGLAAAQGRTEAGTGEMLKWEVLQLCRSGRISCADMVFAPSVAGLFKWRQFETEMILLAVGWYLRFSLSYRDVEELLAERGLRADHVTPQKFSVDCARSSDQPTTAGGWTRRTCG